MKPRRRIIELDGLRGIAVLAVCATHLAPAWPQRYLGMSFGWAGVDLFFVLSGFLITGILRELRDEPGYYSSFYGRRARRILPPAAWVLAAAAGIAIAAGQFQWRVFGMYATFSTSLVTRSWWAARLEQLPRLSSLALSALWTLSVEEIFYVLWAPVVRRRSAVFLAAFSAGTIIVAPFLRLWLHTTGNPEQYLFLTRMDALAWGALAALALEHRSAAVSRQASLRAGLALVSLMTLFVLTDHGDPGHRLFAAAGYTLLDAACACVLVAAVTQPSRWQWLRQPMLVYAGTISYTLYLVHLPMRQIAASIAGAPESERSWLNAVLTLALSTVVASASWRFLESPLLNRQKLEVRSEKSFLPSHFLLLTSNFRKETAAAAAPAAAPEPPGA